MPFFCLPSQSVTPISEPDQTNDATQTRLPAKLLTCLQSPVTSYQKYRKVEDNIDKVENLISQIYHQEDAGIAEVCNTHMSNEDKLRIITQILSDSSRDARLLKMVAQAEKTRTIDYETVRNHSINRILS